MLRRVRSLGGVLRLRQAKRWMASSASLEPLRLHDEFLHRHIGPSDADVAEMLSVTGFETLDALTDSTIPADIRYGTDVLLDIPGPLSELEALSKLRAISKKNKVVKSFIGMGYHGTITPGVISRNVLENPGFYTAYTPYQPEGAQGRLEALLNFQTMVADLTGMHICNASLLDEATAAAEAMHVCMGGTKRHKFFAADDLHPQTLAVMRTRADSSGIELVVGPAESCAENVDEYAGAIFQYPNTFGSVQSYDEITASIHEAGGMVVVAADLLALTQLRSPGDFGADVVVGSAQRFGVPMGFGGPHAGFLATGEKHMRKMPGRVIGVSVDAEGKTALRMAMQTREQHIRRDKATSNICTAQALLANMAGFYGVYHGPDGLRRISSRVHLFADVFSRGVTEGGAMVENDVFFDTVTVNVSTLGLTADHVVGAALANGLNIRRVDDYRVSISFDETAKEEDLHALFLSFGVSPDVEALVGSHEPRYNEFARTSPFMEHPIFHAHRSETQMLRYLFKLQSKDISLNTSMIPLGSCTMKLNATSEMIPISWPEFTDIHPFAPASQCQGYYEMITGLNLALAEITGFAACSTQPNSGAQGEYAGLMSIRSYLQSTGQGHRNICLIPTSAHGTNPASAIMAGMKVVTVKVLPSGAFDRKDFDAKVAKHQDNLAALMVTYPSTNGVFDEDIRDICTAIHDAGGQVYMDGANMNAQCGLTSPGHIGADVCHLNLHKTFCIPHGGGGPGVGTIGVAEHLAPHLPGHAVQPTGGEGRNTLAKHSGAIAAAPFGSAMILPISWMYVMMLGPPGLRKATQVAILNANYMMERLAPHYNIVFRGTHGQCAHEFILDIRPFKKAGIVEEDVAKRLLDYGFHAPTMSWPVPGTLMIEPTESEDRAELDRFVTAMVSIRAEIADVVDGKVDPKDNVLKNAPHTAAVVLSDEWDRPYTRAQAAFPAPWLRTHKFWPTVSRVDNVYGDRHVICSCPPLEAYEDDSE